jgi:hypothetical protein
MRGIHHEASPLRKRAPPSPVAAAKGGSRQGLFQRRRTKKAFESDWIHVVAIPPTAAICREAGELAERYKLRGFDGVHLACFAEMLRGLGGSDDVVFSSFDERQSAAARRLARTIR